MVRKRIIAFLLLGIVLSTGSIVTASEAGRTNTRNALGAYTVYSAIKGHKTGVIVGAAGTILAQRQVDKAIQKRHKQEAYRRAHLRALRNRRHHTKAYYASKRK